MDTTPSSQPKEKKGIKKLWAKVKASMKSDPSVRDSLTNATATEPNKSALTAPVAPVLTPEPTSTSTSTEPTPPSEPTKNIEPEKPVEPTMAITPSLIEVDDDDQPEQNIDLPQIVSTRTITSDKERFAQAQAVFEKYNLTLDAADWRRPSKSTVERVEKKPRMRVRYTCHECNKVFGREKICSECNHNRCTKCIRYPAKKTGDKAKKEKRIETTSAPVSSITTGACHECKTEFIIGAHACENCEHKICERCLRETVMRSPLTAPPPINNPIDVAAS